MSIASEIQKLEPGSLVELFELDATTLGGDYERFHAHLQIGPIWWQGYQFNAWPIEAEGFARSSDRPSNPTLRVGNANGSISALCLYFDDLVGAKVIRRRTFGKFLDAANFADGNPTANPDEEFPPEVWFIEQKLHEDNTTVEFELSSALDFSGVQLPRRQIIANQCPFLYRGAECGYTGGPVADLSDNPTDSPVLDRCGKRLSSCRLRWGENKELPYGGFPAAGLMRG